MKPEISLPKDIVVSDFKRPAMPASIFKLRGKAYDRAMKQWHEDPENIVAGNFEIWYTTAFGWVIPTLLIRSASFRMRCSRPGVSDRTYATTLEGKPVRVGFGPHVLQRHEVWVRQSRLSTLQPYFDLQLKGQQTSNEIRDRISSRRAQGTLRRSALFGW